jgi:rRNA maturation protein Nop10
VTAIWVLFVLAILVMWILPAVLAATFAASNGDSAALWGSVTLITGWGGLIAYVVVAALRPKHTCPGCGQPVMAAASNSHVCDAQLDVLPASEAPAVVQVSSWPMRVCPRCHHDTPADSEVCVRCGDSSPI